MLIMPEAENEHIRIVTSKKDKDVLMENDKTETIVGQTAVRQYRFKIVRVPL